MSNTWKELDTEQKREVPPSTCRYCGEPIYWETLPGGRKQPVNATNIERHNCGKRETKQSHPDPKKEVEVSNNITAHPPYHLANGTIVPSVTTVLGILDKPGLPHWAWELGQQGLDYREVRDAAARVGTIAHYLIACRLKGEKADVSEFSPDEVDKAEVCLKKYLRWEKGHPLAPVMVETHMISEEYRFGGTPDLLAEIDNEFVLVDFKSGGGVYDSMFYQLAGYRKLLEEQGWPVASARILRVGVNDDRDAEEIVKTNLDTEWRIFQCCLEIYRLQRGG